MIQRAREEQERQQRATSDRNITLSGNAVARRNNLGDDETFIEQKSFL